MTLPVVEPGLVVGAAGLAGTLLFFLVAWHRVGRDPRRGTIVPLFTPPAMLSPVAAGYIWHRGFGVRFGHEEAFAVALASLTAKGFVALERIDGGFRVWRMKPPTRSLPRTEGVTMHTLFANDVSVSLTGDFVPCVDRAVTRPCDAIESESRDVWHRQNRKPWLAGCGLAGLSVGAALMIDGGSAAVGTALAIVVFAAALVVAPIAAGKHRLLQHIDHTLRGRWNRLKPALLAAVYGAVHLVPVAIVAWVAFDALPWSHAILLVAAVTMATVFLVLLEAPTHAGRRLLDHLEGYRLYLSLTGTARYKWSSYEHVVTPDLFEHHLPYAMALGVAEDWTESFAWNVSEAPDERDVSRARRTDRDWRGLAAAVGSALQDDGRNSEDIAP